MSHYILKLGIILIHQLYTYRKSTVVYTLLKYLYRFLSSNTNCHTCISVPAVSYSEISRAETAKIATNMHDFIRPSNATQDPQVYPLTLLDQNMPRVYTRLILCIPDVSQRNTELIASATQVHLILSKDLARLVDEVPYLAGNVAPIEESNSMMQIASGKGVSLITTTFAEPVDYKSLQEEHFPIEKLPGHFASLGTLPTEESTPVMAAQANVVKGGIFLTVCMHHSVVDATGMATVIEAWSIYCRNSDMPSVIDASFLDRSPLLKEAEIDQQGKMSTIDDFPMYKLVDPPPVTTKSTVGDIVSRPPTSVASTPAIPAMTSAIFHFSQRSLKKLKHLVQASQSQEAKVSISTYDALSAFLWHALTLARNNPSFTAAPSPDPLPPPETSILGYAVDARSRFSPPLPQKYIGNINLYASTTSPISNLLIPLPSPPEAAGVITNPNTPTPSLASTASRIRHATNSITPSHLSHLLTLPLLHPQPSKPAKKSQTCNQASMSSSEKTYVLPVGGGLIFENGTLGPRCLVGIVRMVVETVVQGRWKR